MKTGSAEIRLENRKFRYLNPQQESITTRLHRPTIGLLLKNPCNLIAFPIFLIISSFTIVFIIDGASYHCFKDYRFIILLIALLLILLLVLLIVLLIVPCNSSFNCTFNRAFSRSFNRNRHRHLMKNNTS